MAAARIFSDASWSPPGIRFGFIAGAAASVYVFVALFGFIHVRTIAAAAQILVSLSIFVAVTRFAEYASPLLAHAVPVAVLCAQLHSALATIELLLSPARKHLALTFSQAPWSAPAWVAVGLVNGYVTAELPPRRRKALVLYVPLSIAITA